MISYITRRLFLMIPTLIGITFLVFLIVAMSPGGIGAALKGSAGAVESDAGANARAVQEAYLEDRYGLDDPVIVQYGRWLARIFPVQFGTRDQRDPTGEVIRYPKDLKVPVLAGEWYGSEADLELPDRMPDYIFDHTWDEIHAAGEEEQEAMRESRNLAYRAAANEYAGARAAYITARTNIEQTLVEYANAEGLKKAVTKDNKPRPGVLRRTGINTQNEFYEKVQSDGAEAIRALQEARIARERVGAIYRAKPYPEVGLALGPVAIVPPDFGRSFTRGQPVFKLIGEALPRTLLLNLIAIPIIYFIAIPSGMLAATRQGTWIDVGSGALFVALWSIPIVWAGVLALGYLAHKDYLGAFPVSQLHAPEANSFTFLPSVDANGNWSRGYALDTLWHVCLPVACLVYGGFAVLSKQTRAAMLDNFNADYVRTAKAKGVAGRDIVYKHVFRNSLLPLITMFASLFPALLSGSVVIERIFTVQGMGHLIIEAINLRDRELLLANVLMISTVNLIALLIADILYALADPRITYD